MAQSDADNIITPNDKPSAAPADAGVPLHNGVDEDKGFFKKFVLKYAYFPILRGISYGAESIFTPLSRIISSRTVKKDPAYEPLVTKLDYLEARKVSDPSYVKGTYTSYTGKILHEGPGEAKLQALYEKSGLKGLNQDSQQANITCTDAKDTLRELKSTHEQRAKVNISRAETIAFLGWTLLNFFSDRKQLKKDLAPVVAIETGKDPQKVSLHDIWSSQNAVAAQSMRRFATQNIMRSVTDLFFLRSVHWGIGAKAVGVTYERMLTETILDSLRGQIRKTQNNSLGMAAVPDIVKTFKASLRRSRQFLNLPALTDEEVEKLDPVLSKIAEAIINRRLGTSEVIYLVGSKLAHNPYTPDALLQEVDKVINIGLSGVAAEGIQKNTPEPGNASAPPETGEALSPKIQKILDHGGQAIAPEHIKNFGTGTVGVGA